MEGQSGGGQNAEVRGRLARYAKILKKHPVYTASIDEAQANSTYDTAASLYLYAIAPVLTEFICWVLRRASLAGKKRLYFLSRDGYQMYLTALRLTRLYQINMECRYLHVSRYSMRLPQYHLNPDKGIDGICTGGIDVTPERILRSAALTSKEMDEILTSVGWQERRRDILDYRKIQKLKEKFRSVHKLQEYLEKHSLEEYENAMGYLEQEGLLSDVPYAIVDSGWVGTMQESMQTLIQSRRPELKMEGYYFGMYELPKGADPKNYHAWYFSHKKGLRRKTGFSNSLFETICSSDEGMTLYYRENNGRFLPVQDGKGNPNSCRLRKNQEVLKDFLKQMQSHTKEESGAVQASAGIRLAERLFHLLMACPTNTEILAYGDNLFSDDMLEGNRRKAAAELTETEIKNQRLLSRLLIAAGIKKTVLRESAWIEGSIARCGRHVRGSLLHARLYKFVVFGRKQLRYCAERQKQ